MIKSQNPLVRAWKWWFTPRSTDPTVVYRERALRVLLPIIILLRGLGMLRNYSEASNLPAPYAPLWVSLAVFIVPILLSIYFLGRQKVGWAGVFFLLHWYLADLLSLPAEGYWYPGYQISIIIQGVLGTLFLPSRAILPFLIFQLTTIGMWGNWLDLHYFDPPLLSSGQPVTAFWTTFTTLAAQETIILFIVRYLRTAMERSLRLQQVSIQQLETEIEERQHVEARLRGVFENSPDIIFEVGRGGTILFANRYADKYEGHQVYQLVPSEYHQQIKELLSQIFITGAQTSLEFPAKEIGGSFEWNSIRVGPVRTNGEVTSLVAIITNIHEQKEAALLVKQRAEQLATIVEIGRAISTLQDLNGVLEIIYHQVQRIAPVDVFFISLLSEDKSYLTFPLTYDLGVRYEEPDGVLRPESRLAKVIQSGKPYRLHRTAEQIAEAEKDGHGVGNYQRKSGSLLFVPLWQAHEVIGVLSIQSYGLNAYPDELVETLAGIGNQVSIALQNSRLFTNIQKELAERQQTEQQIQQRLQELAAIHAVSQAASSILELNALFELVSDELFRIFDIQEIYFALHDRQTNTVQFPYYRHGDERLETDPVMFGQGLSSHVILSRQPLLINHDYERRSSELGVVRFNTSGINLNEGSWLGVPVHAGEQVIGMVCVMNLERENAFSESDVRLLTTIAANVGIAIQNAQLYTTVQQELAERKRIEAIQEKLIGELEQKNAELERFTYTVSHDLRSPLVTIKGFVGMLNKDMRENRPDRVQSDIHRIESAADKMDALLSDLLELSRIGRIVNPPEYLDPIRLIQDALDNVDAQLRSKNVTMNILPGLPKLYGDRIRLREVFENLIGNAAKYMGEQTAPVVEVGFREQDDEPVFYVKDNGMGIDPKYHTRIFNLFEKLNPIVEGTGIGLTIVKRIIEVHGGRIWVESDGLGKGSTFFFTIPDNRKQKE